MTDPNRIVLALARLASVPDESNRLGRRHEQSRLGRVLARQGAAALHGGRPDGYLVTGGGSTRPQLRYVESPECPLALGLTHSGRWIAAGVGNATTRFGIDVQQAPARPVGQLADFLGWNHWFGATTPADANAPHWFAQLWTLWEAVVKCDGDSVLDRTTPAFEAIVDGCIPGEEGCWSTGTHWAMSRRLDDSHWLATVARACDDHAVNVEWLGLDPSRDHQGA